MKAPMTPLPCPHPGLANYTSGPDIWNVLPFPRAAETQGSRPGPAPLPAWPETPPATDGEKFPDTWPSPRSALPPMKSEKTPNSPPLIESAQFLVPPQIVADATARSESHEAEIPIAKEPSAEAPDFTDDDLREAFGPIVEASVRNAVYAKQNGIDTYLEPMLRATIRRALAEYAPASRPFKAPGALDRFVWHVKALFTSRTYEDIFFEKTRRFQVEEVFLLDSETLAMVSYASCDPARHASPQRVSSTVHRLAMQIRDTNGVIRETLHLRDGRSIISRKGEYVVLMALVRGQAGELVSADLEYSLRRIEDHFRGKFQEKGSPMLYTLQPFLEDCLLIQSPASAA